MKWIKSWTQELDSTLLEEGTLNDRGVFFTLRLLAGREDRNGKIKYLNNPHLARLIHVPVEILEISLNFLILTKRVKIKHFSGYSILTICKWHIYQQPMESEMESRKEQKTRKTESPKKRREERRGEEKREEQNEEKKKDNSLAPEETLIKEFQALWKLWPIKKDKEQSFQNYCGIRKTVELKLLEQAVSGYSAFLKEQRVNKNFNQTPLYLSTFLNKDRWREYLGEKYVPSL
jgi:hypothetical protein